MLKGPTNSWLIHPDLTRSESLGSNYGIEKYVWNRNLGATRNSHHLAFIVRAWYYVTEVTGSQAPCINGDSLHTVSPEEPQKLRLVNETPDRFYWNWSLYVFEIRSIYIQSRTKLSRLHTAAGTRTKLSSWRWVVPEEPQKLRLRILETPDRFYWKLKGYTYSRFVSSTFKVAHKLVALIRLRGCVPSSRHEDEWYGKVWCGAIVGHFPPTPHLVLAVGQRWIGSCLIPIRKCQSRRISFQVLHLRVRYKMGKGPKWRFSFSLSDHLGLLKRVHNSTRSWSMCMLFGAYVSPSWRCNAWCVFGVRSWLQAALKVCGCCSVRCSCPQTSFY